MSLHCAATAREWEPQRTPASLGRHILGLHRLRALPQVSSHIQPSTWTCLAEEQYEYAIIRAHLGSGGPDPVARASLAATAHHHTAATALGGAPTSLNPEPCRTHTRLYLAAHSIYNWYSSLMYKKGGRLGIYLFPNVPRGEPEAQIAETIEYLKGYSITYSAERGLHTFDRIWLDIEPQAWSSDKAANAEFIAGLVKVRPAHCSARKRGGERLPANIPSCCGSMCACQYVWLSPCSSMILHRAVRRLVSSVVYTPTGTPGLRSLGNGVELPTCPCGTQTMTGRSHALASAPSAAGAALTTSSGRATTPSVEPRWT